MYSPSSSGPPDPKDVSMVDVSTASQQDSQTQAPTNSLSGQPPQPVQDDQTHDEHTLPPRRKSTIILTDDIDLDKMNIDNKNNGNSDHTDLDGSDQMHIDPSSVQLNQQAQQQQAAQSQNQQQQQQPQPAVPDPNIAVPVDIKWVQGGEKVYVTGSFTGWRKMIGLAKQPDNTFLITLGLPVGTHRFRFVIDNELRFSDFLPTATDQMGNFVNYVEVTPEHIQAHLQQQQEQGQQGQQLQQLQPSQPSTEDQSQSQPQSRKSSVSGARRVDSAWGLTNDDDDMGNGYSRYHEEDEENPLNRRNLQYINDIPPIFTDPKVMEQYYMAIDKQSKSSNGQQQAWLHPPQLPPHLENVILNNYNSLDRDNNGGALPIPNHVVLNHLTTTSIKNHTLAVASIVRYKRKYVTQVLYAPLPQLT
ncbi:5'-AMP-activated protein kinase beta subunit, interation domain-containing protein [Scheffersomyces amazonensis]|uniref:5'-AMP-activated protein kinase beta subunit, interation domain-containing protein n=1 Tax=Scheffersomyces amazonensis TaxID=1078765 RepID=UPI00315DAF43